MKRNQWILLIFFVLLCAALLYFGYKENPGNLLPDFTKDSKNIEAELPIFGLSGIVKGIFDTTIILETEVAKNNATSKTNTPIIVTGQTVINTIMQTNDGIKRNPSTVKEIKPGDTLLVTSEFAIKEKTPVSSKQIDIVR